MRLVIGLILGLLLSCSQASGQTVVYVNCERDADADGVLDNGLPRDGLSWETAWPHMRFAIGQVQNIVNAEGVPVEIWAARGVYRSDLGYTTSNGSFQGSLDRTDTLQLLPGVSWYGGFNGTETAREQRDPVRNETVLCGDLNEDDIDPFANIGDNAHHIITQAANRPSGLSIVDGFIIRRANSSGALIQNGAGMYCALDDGDVIVQNCRFERNVSTNAGGAIADTR